MRTLTMTLAAALLFSTAGCDKDDGTFEDGLIRTSGSSSGSAVSGGSTKGPLQMAEVEALAFNTNQEGKPGAEIDTGETDATTNVTGLFIPGTTTGLLFFDFGLQIRTEGTETVVGGETVVEITSEVLTTDLTTGQAPILHPFETILRASAVLGGQRVFATPLTTMTLRIALANVGNADFGGDGLAPITDGEVLRALVNAQQRVRVMFGYGLLDDVDLLSTPPVLLAGETDDPLVQDRVTQHRTAIEAMGALSDELASIIDGANGVSDVTSANDVFHALADDVTDGAVDGFELDGTPVGVYGANGLAAVQSAIDTIDPTTLVIPNEPNARTVGEVSVILREEKAATDNDSADDTSVDSSDSVATENGSSVSDIDGDGTSDSQDSDIDGDGVANASDAFPLDPTEQADSDDDGIGDNADPSSDADLGGLALSVGSLDQTFDPAVTSYTATVGFSVTSTDVTATTSNADATLTINGSNVVSGTPFSVALAEGSNAITVEVTSEDGTAVMTYDLVVTRQSASQFAQEAYIKASNTDPDDRFGFRVALSGNTLAVGARFENSAATGVDGNEGDNFASAAGAVYVFTRDGTGTWSQQAYIKASNTESVDQFGTTVALSGNTLAVGAPGEDSSATGIGGNQGDNNARDSGAVYVFTRDGTGNWSQQAYIKASNTGEGDRFGGGGDLAGGLALSADTLAVGAPGEDSSATGIGGNQADNNATDSGAVYVFTRDTGGNWSQQAYIKASNTGVGDSFGDSVALSNETLVVGATQEDSSATGLDGNEADNGALNSGAAYVFTRDGSGNWSQQAYVKASNAQENDRFGFPAALSGDTLAIGAFSEDGGATGVNGSQADGAQNSGAAYVFVRDGSGNWLQQAYIKASNTSSSDLFGVSLAVFGDTLVVGAVSEASSATGVGGDDADDSAPGSGAVYAFTRDANGTWSQQAYIKASNTDASDQFGRSVALSNEALAVGAALEDSNATGVDGDQTDNSADSAGAVYLLGGIGDASTNADLADNGLSLDPGTLDQIFDPAQTTYTSTVRFLTASLEITATTADTNATLTINGTSVESGVPLRVDLVEGTNSPMVVEVTAADGTTTKTYSIEVTRLSAAQFAQQAYVKASNSDVQDGLADESALAIDGDTVAVAAPFEDSAATGVNGDQTNNNAGDAGAVYVFTRDGSGNWSQQAYIKASNTNANDRFGSRIALSGNTLAVTAPLEDSAAQGVNGDQADNSAGNAGAVYVFTRDGAGVWSQQAYIKSSNTDTGDQFGTSVDVSGDTLAVGASAEGSSATGVNGDQADNSAGGAGAVYVFTRDGNGDWSQQAYLKASNTDAGDVFGHSVSLTGDDLAVGARQEDSAATGVNGDQTDNNASSAGAVYLFTRDGSGTWSQQAYIKASNTNSLDLFGLRVDLAGGTLAVGASGEDSAATGVSGDEADNSAGRAGAVYVFTRDGNGNWSQQAYIKASNTDPGDEFGWDLALSGEVLAVGACTEDGNATGVNGNEADNNASNAGAVYVFARDTSGTWAQQAYVKSSNMEQFDNLGCSVSLQGDTLVLGAVGEDSNFNGVSIDGTGESDNSAETAGAVYIRR